MKIFLIVAAIFLICIAGFFIYKKVTTEPSAIKTGSTTKHKQENIIKISFVGDLLMHSAERKSGYNSGNNTYNFDGFFTDVKKYFSNCDYVVGSFETPVIKEKSDNLYSGYPAFKNPPEFISAVKNAGINVFVTSNNHVLDQGAKGAVETMNQIEKYGVPYTGTFKTQADRETKPVLFLEKNNIKLALLNYTQMTNMASSNNYAVNYIDMTKIKEDIAFAKKGSADCVIVWLHFGNEYERHPSEKQREIVKEVAALGADIIIGSHPHVIQPMEVLNVNGRKVFVAYSIGNFISNQYWRYSTDGLILSMEIEKQNNKITFKNVNYIPTAVVREYNGPETKNEVAVKQNDKSSDFITGAISRGVLKGSEVKFRVVPAGQALYDYINKIDKALTDKDGIRLKTTWEDTTGLIGEAEDYKIYRDEKTKDLTVGQKK